MRVLIIDDHALFRVGLQELLTRRDITVIDAVGDGVEGIRLAQSTNPDVVLLDLRMPGLDGFQVCRSIKTDPDTAATSVIAMTGYFSAETEARILECGAVRCFAKPVEPSVLSAFIDSVLARQGAAQKTRRRKPRD